MKKSKRIMALIGAILLVLLYVSTLIFAFIDSVVSQKLLMLPLPPRSYCLYCYISIHSFPVHLIRMTPTRTSNVLLLNIQLCHRNGSIQFLLPADCFLSLFFRSLEFSVFSPGILPSISSVICSVYYSDA